MAYSVQLLRLQPRRRAEQKKYTRQAAQINTQIQAVNNLRAHPTAEQVQLMMHNNSVTCSLADFFREVSQSQDAEILRGRCSGTIFAMGPSCSGIGLPATSMGPSIKADPETQATQLAPLAEASCITRRTS
ncbi:hypothetical protein ABBQ38_007348 [Trebouxia sp. C0009 RCD-2024]